MSDPKTTAVEYVSHILERRGERAGISTSKPDFQCEAEEPQPFGGGLQVRVHTWRHWSDTLVKLNADTGELLGYSVDRFDDAPTPNELTEEEALAAAAKVVQIPSDAELAEFQHLEYSSGRRMVMLEWFHVVNGIRIDGDFLRIVMHPETHRVIEYDRKWRAPKLK